jgi:hypothetical protein
MRGGTRLHDGEILVHLRRDGPEQWRKLVLVGRHLSVPSAQRDSELEALVLNFLHASQSR